MTTRLFCGLIFCILFSILNVTKDVLPLGTKYLKQSICQIEIDEFLKNEYLTEMELNITEQELKILKQYKNEKCN